jgi:predicted unusual protein kinase regulating ubiquinone biosynthesis (AarF/ABC1/UbiB family)
MIKLGMYPKIVLDIIGHIPTIAFKSVKMGDFFRASGQVIKHYGEKVSAKQLQQLQSMLLDKNLVVAQESNASKILTSETGKKVLEIYFTQFKISGPIFFDLRPSHFSADSEKIYFSPNNLIYHFEDSFRLSLIKLYKGFYYQQDHFVAQAIEELGMVEKGNEKQLVKLKQLFYNHFGSEADALQFDLNKFNKSFHDIFLFFMEHKIKIKTDFIFLGAYLVTLYIHMQSYQYKFDVTSIFKKIFPEGEDQYGN